MSVSETLAAAATAVSVLNENKAQAKRWAEDIAWCEKRLARSRERVTKLDAERPALEASLEAALKAHAAPTPAPVPAVAKK